VHVLVVEELGADSQQRAVDLQVLPVVALAERRHEGGRLAGREWDPERVGCVDARGGVGGAEGLSHGGTLPRRSEREAPPPLA
jgi:hypothetical protein